MCLFQKRSELFISAMEGIELKESENSGTCESDCKKGTWTR